MEVVTIEISNVFDSLGNVGKPYPENQSGKLSYVLKFLKQWGVIKSYKEFADNIKENPVGLNDLKKGRKKLSMKHIHYMNFSYPFINTDYLVLDEGNMFNDEYLRKFIDSKENVLGYDLIIEKAKLDSRNISEYESPKTSHKNKPKDQSLSKELINCQSELIESKNEIIKLTNENTQLKLELVTLRG